ncbi:MAG TPA: sigma factor [Thermoanaerobaculia bacterium]
MSESKESGFTGGGDWAGRVRDGDREAMRSAVRAYLPHVLRAARGAGLDPAEAEEVTQRTFTTFFEKAQRFEGRSSVRTWLFGILYRKIFERRRELARDEQRQEAIDEAFESRFDEAGRWIRPPHPAPDAALAAKETRRQRRRGGVRNGLLAPPTPRTRAATPPSTEGDTAWRRRS